MNFISHSWEMPSKKPLDVQIEHPVHFSRQQSVVQSIQRLDAGFALVGPVRKSKKIRFVDSVSHLDRRALNNFVFQRRDPSRPLRPSAFRDITPYAPASLGTLLASAFRKDLEGFPPASRP